MVRREDRCADSILSVITRRQVLRSLLAPLSYIKSWSVRISAEQLRSDLHRPLLLIIHICDISITSTRLCVERDEGRHMVVMTTMIKANEAAMYDVSSRD